MNKVIKEIIKEFKVRREELMEIFKFFVYFY